MLSNIVDCIKNLPIFYEYININGEDKTTERFICDAINWLKSLRPQNTWKPNDEQMKALAYAVFDTQSYGYHKNLSSLEQQLKKLREE